MRLSLNRCLSSNTSCALVSPQDSDSINRSGRLSGQCLSYTTQNTCAAQLSARGTCPVLAHCPGQTEQPAGSASTHTFTRWTSLFHQAQNSISPLPTEAPHLQHIRCHQCHGVPGTHCVRLHDTVWAPRVGLQVMVWHHTSLSSAWPAHFILAACHSVTECTLNKPQHKCKPRPVNTWHG